MERIWAGDIHCINGIALRHRFKRSKEVLDGIIVGEGLGLLKAAGVDSGELIFAGLVGGIDKLFGYPVCTNDCETYHRR